MSAKVFPLVLENEKTDKPSLNPEAMELINASKNPHFLVFTGNTRNGKSTTLNQLIRGHSEKLTYIAKTPFKRRGGQESITRGCDLYGPIKLRDFLDKNDIHDPCEDADIFLVDTEGFQSLTGTTRSLIPAVFTMQQVATSCVFFIQKHP